MLQPRASRGRWIFTAIMAVAISVALAALYAPYLYAEYLFDWHGQTPKVLPKPAVPVTGRWVDDYFVIETLDPTTFAIGEPHRCRVAIRETSAAQPRQPAGACASRSPSYRIRGAP